MMADAAKFDMANKFKMGGVPQFDVGAAREAGYGDLEIADHLGKENNFDVSAARKAGYDDDEIVHFLTTGEMYDRTGGGGISGAATTFGRATVGGLADAAGMAVGTAMAVSNPTAQVGAIVQGGTPPALAAGRAISELPGSLRTGDTESLPPEMRPFAVAGEVTGASVPFIFAPIGLAKAGLQVTGESLFGRFFGQILDTARKNPKTFASVEAVAVAGSAQGGAFAEILFPGDAGPRLAGEVIGPFIHPVGLAVRGVKLGFAGAKRAIATMSPAGRRKAAGNYVQRVIADYGEDPIVLARALEQGDALGLTAGMKTGSNALLDIEQKLARESVPFDEKLQRNELNALAATRRAADFLFQTDNPQNLKTAIMLRQRYFSQLVDGRMRQAEQRVAEARARIDIPDSTQRATASVEASEALEASLTELRGAESEVWEAIPKDLPVGTQGLQTRLAEINASLLPGETIPGIPAELLGMIEGGEALTSGALLRFRSRLLARSRESRAQGKWDEARIMGELADGALDDLSALPNTEAVATARAFSRELNDRFSRTFAGAALGETKTGARKIAPEVLIDRAFGAGKAQGAVRFGELRDAAALGGDQFLPPVVNAQERFLTAAATASRDPTTGAINPNRLNKFLTDNQTVLERFPGLRGELSNLESAERLLGTTQALTNRATRRVSKLDAFARLVEHENPAMAVGATLAGKQPVKDFASMARFARRSGEGAVGGLRAASLDFAYHAATNKKDGTLSFNLLGRQLFEAQKGRPPLVQMMIDNNVITREQASNLSLIVRGGIAIEQRAARKAASGGDVMEISGIETLATRISGAKLGVVGGRSSGRPDSLIMAAAGSTFLREQFQKVPMTRVKDLLFEAVENPELMAEIIRSGKPQTARDLMATGGEILKEARFRRIHAALFGAGLVASEDFLEDMQPENLRGGGEGARPFD